MLLLSCFALFMFFLAPPAEALKQRPHPIEDLIEGDVRTPPEGKHIVEERPATPAYPLPSTSKFAQETALETFPKSDERKSEEPELGAEVDEWANWDDWTESDDWDTWNETPEETQEAGDNSAASADDWGWDNWLDEEEKTTEESISPPGPDAAPIPNTTTSVTKPRT